MEQKPLHELRRQFVELRNEAQDAEHKLKTAFTEYNPNVRDEKVRSVRRDLQTVTTNTVKSLRARVRERLADLDAELLRLKYPALTSTDPQTQLRGELMVLNAQLSGGGAYDTDLLKTMVAQGRTDAATTLIQRAMTTKPQTEQAIYDRHAFMQIANQLYADMDPLQDEQRDLTTLQTELDFFEKQVAGGFKVNDLPVELMGMPDQTPTLRIKD